MITCPHCGHALDSIGPPPVPFEKGDLVSIPTQRSCGGYTGSTDAIILCSFDEMYPDYNGDVLRYEVFINGQGPAAWFEHAELSLLEKGKMSLLREWQSAYRDR